jgi:hypothetical protein
MTTVETVTNFFLPFKVIQAGSEVNVSIENHVWKTAYGRRFPVRSMSTKHIRNCIACWNGMGNKDIPEGYLGGRDKWLKIFNDELASRN